MLFTCPGTSIKNVNIILSANEIPFRTSYKLLFTCPRTSIKNVDTILSANII